MAEIINLRQVRKARKRADAERIADANRLKHGRTKAEKRADEAERRKTDAVLDGARREQSEP